MLQSGTATPEQLFAAARKASRVPDFDEYEALTALVLGTPVEQPAREPCGVNIASDDVHREIRQIIDNDWELLDALLGDYVKEYEEMKSSNLDYSKDLEREREQAVIVLIEN